MARTVSISSAVPGAHEHCCTMRATHAQAMRTEMLGMVDGLSAYHLLRGATVEKVTKTPSKSTDEETKVAVEGDKTTNSYRGVFMRKGLQLGAPAPAMTALGAGRSARLPPSGRGACRLAEATQWGYRRALPHMRSLRPPSNRSSKTTKTSAAESAPLPDYVKYVAALDAKARGHTHGVCTVYARCPVRGARTHGVCGVSRLLLQAGGRAYSMPTPCPYQEYHACYSKLVDVRNTYVKANLAMSKNGKKLNDPRGEGDGSGHNYSSMF